MQQVIRKIINGDKIDVLIKNLINIIYVDGPVDSNVLEMLSYLKYYQNDIFLDYESEILEIMGLFYKNNNVSSLKGTVMSSFRDSIREKFGNSYTPIQMDILHNTLENKYFSFSAATSTGKSFVFRELIKNVSYDVVIIVPSRALINEYFIKICEMVKDKTVNILTFVDVINKRYVRRNIFILTPERAKELFKYKDSLNIQLVLFDEAQLGDEDSSRGINFDSIVRRIEKTFPKAKKLFAHPFVKNPEAQLTKNNIINGKAYNYLEKTVGQMFISYDEGNFYHFGIDTDMMGSQRELMNHDPIENIIREGGSILIYTTKNSIYNESVFAKFQKYIDMCMEVINPNAIYLINKLKDLIGATENEKYLRYSRMIALLKKGIIIHHGSLPLQARMILEEFTQRGFCKICFSTSTLVQGINMPFDAVWLETFESSKPLNVRNLIGRAGRATTENKFDYGIVIIKDINKSQFRSIMRDDVKIKEISYLDMPSDPNLDEVLEEFKEAVKNNEISDEYNLTNKEIQRLSEEDLDMSISIILDKLFYNGEFITAEQFSKYSQGERGSIYEAFQSIFCKYLNSRPLSTGEKRVLSTAVRIFIWQVHGRTFKQIVGYRFSYITRIREMRQLAKEIKESTNDKREELLTRLTNLEPINTMGCSEIPDKNLPSYNMFEGIKAYEVKYDRIVFDTYDYIDKIIGLKMKDIYYATFNKYYEKKKDIRALNMATYIKYGTIDSKEILLLRYGLTFETIEWVKPYVSEITEDCIMFKNTDQLTAEQRREIERYLI